MAAEVLLIALGVFLGLAGEQWRQNAEHRNQATATLQRFRAEMIANRRAINDVAEYHQTQREKLKAFLPLDAKAREGVDLEFSGIRPPFLERTAWDLALATQSLAYLDTDLAFLLSRIYMFQGFVTELSSGIARAMYVRTPREDMEGFLSSVELYYDDLVSLEPILLNMYEQAIGEIARALDE